MRLYYAPGTCALAVWIALEWAGADYTVERVDPKSEDYKRINPLGMVPAVDIGTGKAMTQADAILQYVAEQHPQAHLGPDDDPLGRFTFAETMAFLTGDFHPAFWPWFSPQRYTTQTEQPELDAVKAAAVTRVARVLQHLDALIGDSGHVYGGRRSVADAYAFIMAGWAPRVGLTLSDYPRVDAFMQATAADPAVQTVLAASKKG